MVDNLPSGAEILKAMCSNFESHWSYFAGVVEGIKLLAFKDVKAVLASFPDDTFNCILSADLTPETVETRVEQLIALFKSLKYPVTWWVGPLDSPQSLGRLLTAHGFLLREKYVGMHLRVDQWQVSNTSDLLEIMKIESPDQLGDYFQLISHFEINPEAFDKLFKLLPQACYSGDAKYSFYVGYYAGAPVVSGALFFHADVAGIFYICTAPQERRKGYATMMIRYLLTQAKRRGFDNVVLQASSSGKSVYEALGFRPCCVYEEFVLKTNYVESNSKI